MRRGSDCGVLSIGKLGRGQERYYLEAVAEGAEDYYVYAGEAPGRWAGGGAASLGLSGQVGGEHFTAVLRGHDPSTGQTLGRAHGRSAVPGFDLTFSAPKSVSVLFALGDDELSVRMRQAHDVAVDEALAYLRATASHGRRGRGGAHRIETTGFVAAVFRHRTSRAGDPNLHSHAVVANRVLGADGKWSALDARALYVQAKTAGTLYQSSLRHQLRDLGFTWTVAPSGLAEIDQVPVEVRREFSRRRREIEAQLAGKGLTSARAAQAAALETRAAKDHTVDPDHLRAGWRERAAALGFRITELERDRAPQLRSADLNALLGSHGLTARASTFGQRDVLRAVAAALPGGASVAEVERLSAGLLADAEVVELSAAEMVLRGQDVLRRRSGAPGARVPMGASERRYTTRELLAIERSLVEAAVAARGGSAPVASDQAVGAALRRRPQLNEEQHELVRTLCQVADGVQVVDAAAGSGKTTALGAVVDAYLAGGSRVIGTTLSAKAAGVLADQTGLATFTTARLLMDLAAGGPGALAPGTVVVVDEAGQVGSRSLATIQAAVAAVGGKLILVGDPHQLPEIDAGGAFRGLLNRLAVVRLVANHRQSDPEDQARLLELRSGDVATAMASYDEAGRVVRAETSDAAREALVDDWSAAYLATDSGDVDAARADVVMLGLANADMHDLNDRARTRLAAEGVLQGEQVVLGGRGYRVGDHVVTRHNDRRLGVLNGQRWRVAAASPEALSLVPIGRTGGVVDVPATYAEQSPDRLHHAYALTTAVAQGSSVDLAFVLGSDATYREAGYTAASRARHGTRFYVVALEPDEEQHTRARADEEEDPLNAFTVALGQSRAQALALDSSSGSEPSYVPVVDAKRLRLTEQLTTAVAHVEQIEADLAELRRRQVPHGRQASRIGPRQTTTLEAGLELWKQRATAVQQRLASLPSPAPADQRTIVTPPREREATARLVDDLEPEVSAGLA